MKQLACLLLAAGNSSRFGGKKQLALIHGKPMVVHTLNQLKPLFHEALYIVTGASADEVKPYVSDLAHVIENDTWASGMGSSIAKGVRVLCDRESYAGIMIVLVDQVDLLCEDYQQLYDRFDGTKIVASEYNAVVGVPAIFPQSYFEQLLALDSDWGARQIIRQNADQVITVPMPNAALDIDSKQDWLKFQQMSNTAPKNTL